TEAPDVALNEPPLIAPAVRLPPACMVIAPVPLTSPLSAATVAVPVAASRLMAPLLVTTHWLTVRFRPADRATAPPAAPPRPSTCALTLTSRPAVTVSPLPLCVFRTD